MRQAKYFFSLKYCLLQWQMEDAQENKKKHI